MMQFCYYTILAPGLKVKIIMTFVLDYTEAYYTTSHYTAHNT